MGISQALVKEVSGHVGDGNQELILCSKVPEGMEPLQSAWDLCRKRDLVANQVNKYKAQLNLHGGKQELGVNYFETYLPAATWMAICFLLIVAILNCLFLKKVDFVMAYTQAPIECRMYMTLPQGVLTQIGCAKDFVLHLINNIYRQKQLGLVLYAYISDRLQEIKFQPLKSDECVFIHGKCVFDVYVDGGIFMCPDKRFIDKAIKDLQAAGLKIEDQGYPSDHVGVKIKQNNHRRLNCHSQH